MTTATDPFEEPTVYGTLFEQADPWDTIGQILGLPNTKSSKIPGEVTNELSSEIDWSEASSETSSLVGGTVDDIPELQYPPLIETPLFELQKTWVSPRRDSDKQEELYRKKNEEAENASTARNQGAQQDVAQAGLGDIEDEQLFIGKELESVLATPKLQEMDGLFIGPSLFELDKDEDEI